MRPKNTSFPAENLARLQLDSLQIPSLEPVPIIRVLDVSFAESKECKILSIALVHACFTIIKYPYTRWHKMLAMYIL